MQLITYSNKTRNRLTGLFALPRNELAQTLITLGVSHWVAVAIMRSVNR